MIANTFALTFAFLSVAHALKLHAEPNLKKIKIAAAQVKPAYLDRAGTTGIIVDWIDRAGKQNVTVLGFPEAFLPGYPSWFSYHPVDSNLAYDLHLKLFENAISVPGPETELIGEACRKAGIYAVIGCSEKRENTTGTMWNTQLVFGPSGDILLKHQKYVPTTMERLPHMPGTTGSQAAIQTDFGGLSTLICGENSNPLAAYNLVATDSPTVHVASWPTHFAGGWSLYNCTLIASKALAYTMKAFVINACAVIGDDAIAAWQPPDDERKLIAEERKLGLSTIIDPMGEVIAGPAEAGETLLVAEVDLTETVVAKYTHDFGGHYNRPDIFAHLFTEYFSKDT
ncbi:Nitrilase 3 [Colletotrichum gloeosporioides]|uniref:Nitrilase 3 n=1 Tax=Colletotrichum gloeosporioides TaxID=474922 RepID=A0A8H4CQF8_COLGL|nr:Nitrilase 3 [Colletotrichum gloeosporioides]KAF3808241.1 Nitrilase 3 [Colletotrichum gloeosporioides]